jgi:hypothetical protein
LIAFPRRYPVIAFAITATRTYFDAGPSKALVHNAGAPQPHRLKAVGSFFATGGRDVHVGCARVGMSYGFR